MEARHRFGQSAIQAVFVLVVVGVALFVATDQTLPPDALPSAAPASEFSAGRAIEHIEAIARDARIPGTPGYAEPRDYVVNELSALGLQSEIQQTRTGIPAEMQASFGWSDAPVVDVENVVARMDGTVSQDAVMLVAHLDTTPYGPGATDDGAGVSALLETARAIHEGPPLRNSVILLFTGPEETGYHGAVAFIREHPWIEDVKLVINLDAGGLSGPSELTGTSPNSGWLIRQATKAESHFYGTSASGEGLSDFRAFDFYGFSGFALDYSWDRRIHTPFDNVDNVNLSSLQHQGYRVLALTRHFGNLESLEDPGTADPIYFNVLRLGVIQYSRGWVVPIAVLAMLVYAGAVGLGVRRGLLTPAGIGLGGAVFSLALVASPLLALGLWAVLSNVVDAYQVTYLGHAVNEYGLLALFAFTTLALTSTLYAVLHKIRPVTTADLTIGAFGLLALATVVFAVFIPDSSYASAWTGLVGFSAVGFWFATHTDDRDAFSVPHIVALTVAAVVAIILIWPAALATFMAAEAGGWFLAIILMGTLLGTLVPQVQIITRPNQWWPPVAALVGTVVLLVFALFP